MISKAFERLPAVFACFCTILQDCTEHCSDLVDMCVNLHLNRRRTDLQPVFAQLDSVLAVQVCVCNMLMSDCPSRRMSHDCHAKEGNMLRVLSCDFMLATIWPERSPISNMQRLAMLHISFCVLTHPLQGLRLRRSCANYMTLNLGMPVSAGVHGHLLNMSQQIQNGSNHEGT